MAYAAITIEGGLLPADVLDQIVARDAEKLRDQTQQAFSAAADYWTAFNTRLAHSREARVTLTRREWVLPLFELLGYYDVPYQQAAAVIDRDSYDISHRLGNAPGAPPLHIMALPQGDDTTLDRRTPPARRSPHGLVQEYLNRSDELWGIVTDGARLRLLRNAARLSRPTYIEFDLRAIMADGLYSEFVVLFVLLHAGRMPTATEDAASSPLEQDYQTGVAAGGRVRDQLRDGVEQALRTLGTALLQHPENAELREAVASGQLDAAGYYRQLLRVLYRLLFLFVAEERQLLYPLPADAETAARQAIYRRYYSVSRLRDHCERRAVDDGESDLWAALRQTFRLLRDETLAAKVGLCALGGELFGETACADVESAACANAPLLAALFDLWTFLDRGEEVGRRGRRATKPVRRRVNYAALDVEEFGSIYESLLDFGPAIELQPEPRFDLLAGTERKSTGSYYTPTALVDELIKSALMPVVEERKAAAKTAEEKERALLALRIVDPASGSGHFLLAAARRVARELAKLRSGEDEPSPTAFRLALRDVIRSCIYAVDTNPLAVDLCKVALWIEGYCTGLPLSFLDQHVKLGNSLIGVFDEAVLEAGIPDEAYTPVTGDDKAAAAFYKKQNKAEREGQLSFDLDGAAERRHTQLAHEFGELAQFAEETAADVQAKEELYAQLRGPGGDWWTRKVACDLWTAAFFAPLLPQDAALVSQVPTTSVLQRFRGQPKAAHGQVVGAAVALSERNRFFHWPLEFPEVFDGPDGGFDVVLGNPPWEQLQPEETKFFAGLAPEIATLAGAKRKAAIEKLPTTNPDIAARWEEHKRGIETGNKFIRDCGRFRLSAEGKLNTYSIFAETMRGLLAHRGRAGFIVPDTMATNATTAQFFDDLVQKEALHSLYGFKNERFLFSGIEHTVTYALVTVGGRDLRFPQMEFCWLAWTVEEFQRPERRVMLTAEDMALLNPNTRTCPIFRSRRDAELTRSIYRRVPVLVREGRDGEPDENPWGMSLRQGLFNMTSDSALFRERGQLEREGWRLVGNVFVRSVTEDRYVPLYEAKLLHQFDHRWATYEDLDTRDRSDAEKADPACLVLPRYWVPQAEVEAQLKGRWERGWLLGWRDIARNTDLRTVIATLLPRVGFGDPVLLALPSAELPAPVAGLVANLDSFIHDYAARQKVGGTHLKFHLFQQLPILSPETYDRPAPWMPSLRLSAWLAPRVLELVYTARDMQPFARDLGYDGPPFRWDEERRFLLRSELDAAFFHLYGIARDDVDYIMDTFSIVRRRDEQRHGEYRTKRVILDIYDAMAYAMQTGEPYQTRLDPPPADPRAAHGPAAVRVG